MYTKKSFLKHDYFWKKLPTSNLAYGCNNPQIGRSSEFVFDSENVAPFSTFSRWSGKQRVLRISEITQYFQKCFTDYDGVLGLYKKNLRRDIGLPNNLVFLFQVENDFHGKSENIEYLTLFNRFFSSFQHVFGKIICY